MLPARMNGYYTYVRFDTTNRAMNRKVDSWQVPAGRLAPSTPSVLDQAINRANNLRAFANSTTEQLTNLAKNSALFRIEIYRKYAQSVAVC